jgi:hypothetical protein
MEIEIVKNTYQLKANAKYRKKHIEKFREAQANYIRERYNTDDYYRQKKLTEMKKYRDLKKEFIRLSSICI